MNKAVRFWDRLRRKILTLATGRCAFCRMPTHSGSCLCDDCRKKLLPLDLEIPGRPYEKAFCAYVYEGVGRSILLRYKFSDNWVYYLDPLFDGIYEKYKKCLSSEIFDAVVPVPAYRKKVTHLTPLAKRFGAYTDIPYKPEYLIKKKKTEKQHLLSAARRHTNLIGAFSASKEVKGKRILLLDDIMTTGSTAAECSETLLKAGAEAVVVLAAFHTMP